MLILKELESVRISLWLPLLLPQTNRGEGIPTAAHCSITGWNWLIMIVGTAFDNILGIAGKDKDV